MPTTNALRAALQAEPNLYSVDSQELDPGDSHTLLARHLHVLLPRSLHSFSGD